MMISAIASVTHAGATQPTAKAGAAGIQTTTPATTHIASGQHVALTSGEHIAASGETQERLTVQDS